ncbi:MAG: transposase [Magnetococcales bacterium]|nr:transposase [Magnetococcales bacterium]
MYLQFQNGSQRRSQGKQKEKHQGSIRYQVNWKLYAIEKRIRGQNPKERFIARQNEVPPILAKLKARLDEWQPKAVPSATLSKALNYLSEQWPRLVRYQADTAMWVRFPTNTRFFRA